MPRIDPVQLLKCLSVLLSPTGGIKSKDEVQRLASLMAKFSKKLVSKCIYIQILKKTDTELLGSFMSSGGWPLVHMWLDDGVKAENWPLIQELLELLLLCPVDTERLKANDCPRLVKELSKTPNHAVIQALAAKLVEQWLKLVKGKSAPPLTLDQLPQITSNNSDANSVSNSVEKDGSDSDNVKEDDNDVNSEIAKDENDSQDNTIPILKISVKDGKQVVSKVSEKSDRKTDIVKSNSEADKKNSSHVTHKENDKNKKKDSSKSSSSSRSSNDSKSKHSSSSDQRHSSSSNSSDSISKNRDKSKSSSSSHRDSDRHKDRKNSADKDKVEKKREREKSKSSSDRHKEYSEKSKEEKSKEQSDKVKEQINKGSDKLSIMKLGKIPKKSSSEKLDPKKDKPSISIEVRNPNDANRPKTVKTFNSKFRSHGLEEEAKPPPPRGSVKKPNTPALPLLSAPKRPSPIRSLDVPPEKKPKMADSVERPGAIKLIPPKPKPAYLLESGLFMDALTASATNKKEPRKRKRRISESKENPAQNDVTPPASPNNPTPTSPVVEESKPTPLRFYQDTLDTEEEDKVKEGAKSPTDETKPEEETESPTSPPKEDEDVSAKPDLQEDDEEVPTERFTADGLRSVLCLHKKKGPKKSLRWRDTNLEEVQFFELDETERVNVTKNFSDMKQMEHTHEREAFKKGRNLANEDFMEERTMWRKLIPVDIDKDVMVDFGKNSKEKVIQMTRQANVLQALYFHSSMIPDSPAEADIENHPASEPTIVPLDDVTGNSDSVNDFQNTPWPEPKTNPQVPPPNNTNIPNPHVFPNMPPFNPQFQNAPYGMPGPGFPPGPGMMPPIPPNEWPVNGPNAMMPDNMNMNPDMYMGPGPGPGPGPGGMMFPGPMNDYPPMDNMNGPSFQPGFNGPMGPGGPSMGINRPMGPNGPRPFGFNKNRGGGIRGSAPRGGHMWRGKGPGNWNGPHRGNGGHRGNGRVCAHFQKRGFCRDGDQCTFLHTGGNRSHY